MAGSDAAVYAKTRNIPTELYTDADAFADLCAMKRDIYAGYLGFCTDGHGDIQWLTVYAADCTHDGYAIGVCEYCSAILEERHTTATGHNYVVSETPAADGRDRCASPPAKTAATAATRCCPAAARRWRRPTP